MKSLFSMDSKFGQLLYKLGQMVLLSYLWLLTSLPIITCPAACTALYYTTRKLLAGEEGKLTTTYFTAFKQNFKQATVVGLIAMVITAVFVLNAGALFVLGIDSLGDKIIAFLFCILGAFLATWLHFVPAYIARFVDNNRTVFKNSFLMCLFSPLRAFRLTLQAVIVAGAILYLNLIPYLPLVISVLPGAYCAVAVDSIEKVFQKYIPEETPEEIPEETNKEKIFKDVQ